MLEHFLVSEVFTFFLIFSRVGSGILVLPGFGETYVSQSIRLSFALAVAFLLTPLLGKIMPPLPDSPIALALLVISEIFIGLFIGGICNILISALHTAGMIFSMQSGMSSAVIFDVNQNTQGSLVGSFLGILVIVLIFATDLHFLMLRGITESYTVFAPGHFPPLHDFVETETRAVADTFAIAVQISAPLIVGGMLLFLGGGIISRLMPTIQVFFILVPVQLFVGFFILMTSFSVMMLWYMEFFKDKLTGFMGYLH